MAPSGSNEPPPNSPGLTPPPGQDSYVFSPFTLAPYHVVTVALCIITTTTLVIARIYTKYFVVRKIGWEDYSCVLGWLSFVVFMAMSQSIAMHGGGTHQWNILYKDLQYHWRIENYCDMIYSISLLTTKISIMLLIQRVFCSVSRDIPFYLTTTLMYANTFFYLSYIIVAAALCNPRRKIWTPTLPGRCVDFQKLYLASAIFNMLSDIGMLGVPIYLVWKLQMSVRRKIGISAIFFSGGLACASSLLRVVYVCALIRTDDYSYVQLETQMWSFAEIAFGLSCSCLVVLPRLYQHFCDITPYATTAVGGNSDVNEARSQSVTEGRTKREWVQLEQQAERAKRSFGDKARVGDEEAFDRAVV